MSLAKTYRDLRKPSKEQLIRLRDEATPNTVIGLGFYREEIARREQDEQNRAVLRLAWVMTALTVVNAIVVIVALVG